MPMSQTIAESNPSSAAGTLPLTQRLHDDPLPAELLEHVASLRLIVPILNISVLALHRQDAESDTDIAHVLTQHACDPLDTEIERIESLLASHLSRHRQPEMRT
jgi:hypothetical protein